MRKALLALVVLALAMPAVADDGSLALRAKGEVVGFLALTPDQTTQWDALLATDQQAKLAFLHRADQARPVIPAFRLFGLLPPPPPWLP